MSFIRHTALYRVLSAVTIALVVLTMLTQARQGQMQGAADSSFERHDICEPGMERAPVTEPRTASLSSIVETPSFNFVLTGVIRVSVPAASSFEAGTATVPATQERMFVSNRISPGDTHPLRFIPSPSFSSVLRL